MSTIAATITDLQLMSAPEGGIGARKTYRLLCNTATSLTAGDTAAIVSVDVLIKAITKGGQTLTLAQCMGGPPGLTTGGTACYALAATVNGASLQFSLGGTTAAAAITAPATFSLFVSLDES